MKKPCGKLQRILTAGLAALLVCCISLAGCGKKEETGNLPALENTGQTGETASENNPESFQFDTFPEVISESTQSSAEESPAEKEERCFLTLLMTNTDRGLEQAVSGFNRQSDRYTIHIEKCNWGEELITRRERLQVELIAGKGPDIFIGDVMPNTNESFLDKGILMDLAPLLDTAGITDEAYFPAVRALTLGEHVYGICTNVQPHGCWVSESVLGGREQPDLETLVDKLYSYPDQKAVWRQHISYYLLLDAFLGGSENLWGMIDWERGKCDFSGDLFAKILQITKRYADPDGIGQTAVAGWYNAGQDFREDLENEGKVILNYPFDDGWYPYCSEIGALMVNANTKYPEGAWEFIKYLLGEKGQNYAAKYCSNTALPFNRAMADSYIDAQLKKCEEGGSSQIWIMRGDTLVEYVPTKELTDELRDYVNRARYRPLKTKDILSIIYEETELYFHGDKSLEAVCEVIQNRVQLYLDENG